MDEHPIRLSRRVFLHSAGGVVGAMAVPLAPAVAADGAPPAAPPSQAVPVALDVNGQTHRLLLEPRVTLLDALREQLGLTGTKKGCDRGQCGACTVLVDGRRVNACLSLAVMQQGKAITTIEGLGTPQSLHPMQRAFIEHDAFQCGYCTPGQICSAVAMVGELRRGAVSAATPDVRGAPPTLGDDEIRERMSGNLCRCGAYPNIVTAVRSVASAG